MKKFLITVLILVIGMFAWVFDTSAITYQTPVGVNFTFNPRLVITLSSADLIIPNLAPGSAADSNTITVTVNTNTAYGYTLNATVGQDTNYETRNLIKSGTEANFSSIAYGSSLASLTTDNTWGYAYKPSGNGSSWTTYSGLPLYSDTTNVATLISTWNPADSDSVEFKIGAKASVSQPAGEYKNIVNFVAVSNPGPLTLENSFEAAGKTKLNGYYKMQDMNTGICDAVDAEEDRIQLIDTRDSRVYWVSKFADGRCWMIENLRLNPTDSTTAGNMNATNTNAPADAIANYLNGGNVNNVAGWSTYAVRSTMGTDPLRPDLFASYENRSVTAYGAIITNDQAELGILYNYCAVTAGTYCYSSVNYNDIPNTLIDAPYDICPYGWRLPTGGPGSEIKAFYDLYSGGSTNASDNTSLQYKFSIAFSGGIDGNYGPGGQNTSWYIFSSTVNGSDTYGDIYEFNTWSDRLWDPATTDVRRSDGISMRCIAK